MDIGEGQASWMNDWMKVIASNTLATSMKPKPDPRMELFFLEKAKTYEEKRNMNTEGLRKLSKIKLKKKRSLKKFLMNPKKYIKFPSFSLLPIRMKIAAKTIGLDLVSVVPLSAPTGTLFYMDTKKRINHLGIEI
jgi:hypothetical protein